MTVHDLLIEKSTALSIILLVVKEVTKLTNQLFVVHNVRHPISFNAASTRSLLYLGVDRLERFLSNTMLRCRSVVCNVTRRSRNVTRLLTATAISPSAYCYELRCSIDQRLRICSGDEWRPFSTMTWREYHDFTKHSVDSLSRAPHVLDWVNMPDPFRHYEGVPLLDLPADPPVPETSALEVLQGVSGTTSAAEGSIFLSQLLFYSAAISAFKRVPSTGDRYALRVNPSSGNLHPTEFHFLSRGLKQWPDGLYHYRPSAHMAEQRALGNCELNMAGRSAPIIFVLTSIAWREAWKYRDRAYRAAPTEVGP